MGYAVTPCVCGPRADQLYVIPKWVTEMDSYFDTAELSLNPG